jgi:hypothetical protein
VESDADRRATIRGLGGELVSASGREPFWAIVDRDPEAFTQGGRVVDSYAPELVACTADVSGMEKGERLTIDGEPYYLKTSHDARPAPGWTTVTLRR